MKYLRLTIEAPIPEKLEDMEDLLAHISISNGKLPNELTVSVTKPAGDGQPYDQKFSIGDWRLVEKQVTTIPNLGMESNRNYQLIRDELLISYESCNLTEEQAKAIVNDPEQMKDLFDEMQEQIESNGCDEYMALQDLVNRHFGKDK